MTYSIIILIFIIGSPLISFAKEAIILKDQATSLIYPVYWHIPFGIHRGTQDHLASFSQNRTQFKTPQGLACNRLLEDVYKNNTSTAFRLTIMGANTGQANIIYNPTLLSLSIIGPKLKTLPSLVQPMDVALSDQGIAYITDPAGNKVLRFHTVKGKLHYERQLLSSTEWNKPYGIAVDSDQNVYVTDKHSNQILIFNDQSKQFHSIGSQISSTIRLNAPKAIAVVSKKDPWSFYHKDALYVCDQQGHRILRLDLQGQLQTAVTTDMLGTSSTAFAWIALDYFDNVWATAPAEGKVYKLDKDLKLLTIFGEPGKGDYKFDHPTGISIYRHFGQVFIAESEAVHYFWIGADISQATLVQHPAQNDLWTVKFFLTEPTALSLDVKKMNSKKTYKICKDIFFYSGKQSYSFRLPKNTFSTSFDLLMTAEAIYSTRTHFKKRISVPSKK